MGMKYGKRFGGGGIERRNYTGTGTPIGSDRYSASRTPHLRSVTPGWYVMHILRSRVERVAMGPYRTAEEANEETSRLALAWPHDGFVTREILPARQPASSLAALRELQASRPLKPPKKASLPKQHPWRCAMGRDDDDCRINPIVDDLK